MLTFLILNGSCSRRNINHKTGRFDWDAGVYNRRKYVLRRKFVHHSAVYEALGESIHDAYWKTCIR